MAHAQCRSKRTCGHAAGGDEDGDGSPLLSVGLSIANRGVPVPPGASGTPGAPIQSPDDAAPAAAAATPIPAAAAILDAEPHAVLHSRRALAAAGGGRGRALLADRVHAPLFLTDIMFHNGNKRDSAGLYIAGAEVSVLAYRAHPLPSTTLLFAVCSGVLTSACVVPGAPRLCRERATSPVSHVAARRCMAAAWREPEGVSCRVRVP